MNLQFYFIKISKFVGVFLSFVFFSARPLLAQTDLGLSDLSPRPGGRQELSQLIRRALAESRTRRAPVEAALRSWFDRNALSGHTLTVIPDGPTLHRTRLELIASARRMLYISAFHVIPEPATDELIQAICARVRDGIDVRVLVDALGGGGYMPSRIAECGGRATLYDPLSWNLAQAGYAMHEKIMVADGTHIILGGSGFADQYAQGSRSRGRWHDIDIDVRGPVACWFHRKFMEIWRYSSQQESRMIQSADSFGPYTAGVPDSLLERMFGLSSLQDCTPELAPGRVGQGIRMVPVYNNPMFTSARPLLGAYLTAMFNSQNRIWLYAPYFAAEPAFSRGLIEARRFGVDVRIVANSPESVDTGTFTSVAYLNSMQELLAAGVKIYLWPRNYTMHRKAGLFDSRYAYFGSDNLDRRGQRFSTESIVFTDDQPTINQLATEFEHDFEITIPLTERYRAGWVNTRSPFWRWLADLLVNYI